MRKIKLKIPPIPVIKSARHGTAEQHSSLVYRPVGCIMPEREIEKGYKIMWVCLICGKL